MIVVNFFGGPNTGKSTMASGLFYKLKRMGVNCELTQEYAKDMTYEKRGNILADQLYILAKQNRRLDRVKDMVDVAITDSPLILGSLYASADYFPSYRPLLIEVFESYENVNYRLKAVKRLPYQKEGRNQTEHEAIGIDNDVQKMLDHYDVDYRDLHVSPESETNKTLDVITFDLVKNYPSIFPKVEKTYEGQYKENSPSRLPRRVIVGLGTET